MSENQSEKAVNRTASATAATGTQAVTAAQVSDFLKANPDFFLSQDELLAEITLPHERGQAISLLERQVRILRERSVESRHTLNKLIENARYNDQLFSVTRNLVLTLLGETEIADITRVTEVNLATQPGIDACCVILFDDSQLSGKTGGRVENRNNISSQFPDFFNGAKTHCMNINKNQAAYLFPHESRQVRSVALCPIGRNPGRGVLVIGNQARDYFNSDLDTLFLDFIGEVLDSLLQSHAG
ncbi:MAG: DUF484 family protein [Pseudomonadales bacterium]|nr:DUF484 family protein [Pseudomonadales bacterium]